MSLNRAKSRRVGKIQCRTEMTNRTANRHKEMVNTGIPSPKMGRGKPLQAKYQNTLAALVCWITSKLNAL